MRARALEGLAQTDLAQRHFDEATEGLTKALAEQIAATGELHLRPTEILNELGSVEYLRGRSSLAPPYFRRALAIQRKIFGPKHSLLAPALNNLGRVLLEQRQFTESAQLLTESIDISKAEVLETSVSMAFRYTNLALAEMGLGHLDVAEPLFQKGLTAAIANKHRLHGPILIDLADLECRSRRFEQGLKRLEEARPIVAARYPDDPWRVAHVDNVRAGCLTGLKRYAEARALMISSLPAIRAKWIPDSLYGHDALQRKLRLLELTQDPALK
jgi:tetratricopeptide (TPR) repeat protein